MKYDDGDVSELGGWAMEFFPSKITVLFYCHENVLLFCSLSTTLSPEIQKSSIITFFKKESNTQTTNSTTEI